MADSEGCTYYQITVTPPELNFTREEGLPTPPEPQWLRVDKTGSGNLPPRWVYTSDVPWLDIRPMSHGIPAKIMVRPKTPGMALGDYEGHITFTTSPVQDPIVILVKLSITPKPPPVKSLKIVNTEVPGGIQGEPYLCQFAAEGGTPPYSWTCSGVPEGLSIDFKTGELKGRPTMSGSFQVTIYVTDPAINADQKEYTLNIAEAPKPPVKVTITSPFGGEVWLEGETHVIEWTAENVTDETLAIAVVYGNVQQSIATSVLTSSGVYAWTVNTTTPNETNMIRLFLPDGLAAESQPFAIRQHQGCSPIGPFMRLFRR